MATLSASAGLLSTKNNLFARQWSKPLDRKASGGYSVLRTFGPAIGLQRRHGLPGNNKISVHWHGPLCATGAASSGGEGVKLNLNLPRRTLMVSFNCDACGTRTKRIVNRHAYERGTVFVQCAGCEAYHKLVDNLGLIVEYDFRDDPDGSSKELRQG